MDGCPFDTGKEKLTLSIKLIDFYDTTEEKLVAADHGPGPKCRCGECIHLKDLEDRWILKMGTFYGDSRLYTRHSALLQTPNLTCRMECGLIGSSNSYGT